MEAIRPQLNRHLSQDSTLSQTSTLAPSVKRLSPAPSYTSLRPSAAKLGLGLSASQEKDADVAGAKNSFNAPTTQMPSATHRVRLVKPADVDLEKNLGTTTTTVAGTSVRRRSAKALVLTGVAIGIVGSGAVAGFTLLGIVLASSN